MEKLNALSATPLQPLERRPKPAAPAVTNPADVFQPADDLITPLKVGRAMSQAVSSGARWLVKMDRLLSECAWASLPILAPALRVAGQRALGASSDGSFLSNLQESAPQALRKTEGRFISMASGSLEKSFGLSPEQLFEVQRFLDQKVLATRTGPEGTRQVAPMLGELAYGPQRDPYVQALLNTGPRPEQLSPYGSFIYLGADRAEQAAEVKQAFDEGHFLMQGVNPYRGTELEGVWTSLQQKVGAGKLPAFIDLDGDLRSDKPTEIMATATVASLVERLNELGGEAAEARPYFQTLVDRVQTYYDQVDPWLARERPEVHRQAQAVKAALGPAPRGWLARLAGGSEPSGTPDPAAARQALERVDRMAQGPVDRFADLAISLDRDLYSGLQTHWVRMLRSATGPERQALFAPLAQAWVTLSLEAPEDLVRPPGGPLAQRLKSDPLSPGQPVEGRHGYDRALALGEVVNHTLYALGVGERREFLAHLEREIQAREPVVMARERQLRAAVPGYELPADLVVQGLVPDVSLVVPALGRLSNVARSNSPVAALAARHMELLTLCTSRDTRYGEAADQLTPATLAVLQGRSSTQSNERIGPDIFADGDLGLGEFYLKPGGLAPPARVRPDQVEQLGEGPGETRLSLVLEGGGGKGFCYVECLAQLKEALAASRDGRFLIDEYAGTSAGAITAGLLAAGFPLEELNTVLQQLDFKKFFGDYMQNQGGVDPKVRSVTQAGMFSSQAMYRTLHEVLAEKLGIEGRPILFRDLPFNLKVTTTVLNTDLPEDHPLRQSIGPDGQLTLSAQNAPNFDVVAAMVASACIPGVFNPSQILVGGDIEQGRLQTPYRLQLMDGGAVNNFPVMSATRAEEGKTGLAVLPAHYGELSTLDFDAEPGKLERINQANQANYQRFMTPLVKTLNEARQDGYGRFAVAFNLTDPGEQSDPVLQGSTRSESLQLLERARSAGTPVMEAEAGARVVSGQLPQGSVKMTLATRAVDALLDNQHDVLGPRSYRPSAAEADGLGDVLLGAAGAGLIAAQHGLEKRFEQG